MECIIKTERIGIIPEGWALEPGILDDGDGVIFGHTVLDGRKDLPVYVYIRADEAGMVTIGKKQDFSLLLETNTVFDQGRDIGIEEYVPLPPGRGFWFTVTGTVTETYDAAACGYDHGDTAFIMTCRGYRFSTFVPAGAEYFEPLHPGDMIKGAFLIQGWPELE